MSASQLQWIGSSCGRHGSYTFYKGFRINCDGAEKSYCLGEFYFVRNSDNSPICIAELQLIWHDASTDNKLASARLYFKPENTSFGRLSIHGENELLYADQKVIVKCEDMVQWECNGTEWTTGFNAPRESDLIKTHQTSINQFTGELEYKYELQNKNYTNKDFKSDKIIIMTFQAYCRYIALIKRLQNGMTLLKSRLKALGGVLVTSRSTRIVFCRESFNCPELEKMSGENKAPVLKGRPRKKRLRNTTLAKELKRKRFLADLEKVKNNLLTKKPKLSESEEGTESDLSEESVKSGESMDESELPRINIHTPIDKTKTPNGFPMSIKQVVMVIGDKNKVPPPLIPTTKLKSVLSSPPPLQKVKYDIPMVTKLDSGPPPLCPITKRPETLPKNHGIVRVSFADSTKIQPSETPSLPLGSKVYTVVRSVGNPSTTSTVSSAIGSKIDSCKSTEPQGGIDSRTVVDTRQIEGKENLKDTIHTKKKRLRQPGSMRDFNEDSVDDDEKFFMRSLREFMKSRDTPISKIPALGFKRVNLWTMYKTAQKLGGYEMVTTKRLWRQVYDALGGSTTITSAATYTRRHYERLLLPYERFVRGQLNSKKTSMSQSTKATHDSTVSRDQSKQPINGVNQLSNKNHSPALSRITINNMGSSQHKDPVDNKGIPNMTNSLSHDGLKTTVVKMKPNGTIPPYSVSVQASKRDDVTASTIVTKSVDVPVSPVQSLPASRDSKVSDQMSKSASAVTKVFAHRKTSVTSQNVTQSKTHHVSSSVAPTYNSVRTSPSLTSWKKDNVTSSCVTKKSCNVTEENVDAQNARVVTIKQNNVSEKQSIATQNNVTETQSTIKNISTSKIVDHKDRELGPSYCATSDDVTRGRQRKTSDTKVNGEKRSSPKYLTIAETYELLRNRKRFHEEVEPTSKPIIDVNYDHESTELLTKRRKTPSPRDAASQRDYVSYADASYTYAEAKTLNNTSRSYVRLSSSNSTHADVLRTTGTESKPRNEVCTSSCRTPSSVDVTRNSSSFTYSVNSQETRNHAKDLATNHADVLRKNVDAPRSHASISRSEIAPHKIVRYSNNQNVSQSDYCGIPRENGLDDTKKKVFEDQSIPSRFDDRKRDKTMSSRAYDHQPMDVRPEQNDTGTTQLDKQQTTAIRKDEHNRMKQKFLRLDDQQPTSLRRHDEQQPITLRTNEQQSKAFRTKDIVDLTEGDSSPPYSYRSPSPLYRNIQYTQGDSCQRTEPRFHRSNVNGSVTHEPITQSKRSREYTSEVSHDIKHVKPSNGHDYFKADHQALDYEFQSKATDRGSESIVVQRGPSAASPDAHFQEWRRRQEISQYPAYINTVNTASEQITRRNSINEQLHPQTSPHEHRYIYLPEDMNGMPPRVLEEVPFYLGHSKTGLYYHDDVFYNTMPFYHGSWPATGVTDAVAFKTDAETLRNNNHLRSTSCVFMPTSQMFGSAAQMAPISPPLINQGHVTGIPETMHQHCVLASQYSHNHVIVTQTPTRPLHSFT